MFVGADLVAEGFTDIKYELCAFYSNFIFDNSFILFKKTQEALNNMVSMHIKHEIFRFHAPFECVDYHLKIRETPPLH